MFGWVTIRHPHLLYTIIIILSQTYCFLGGLVSLIHHSPSSFISWDLHLFHILLEGGLHFKWVKMILGGGFWVVLVSSFEIRFWDHCPMGSLFRILKQSRRYLCLNKIRSFHCYWFCGSYSAVMLYKDVNSTFFYPKLVGPTKELT